MSGLKEHLEDKWNHMNDELEILLEEAADDPQKLSAVKALVEKIVHDANNKLCAVYLTEPPQKHRCTINGLQVEIEGREVSYEQLCELAGYDPHANPTCIFKAGSESGMLTHGELAVVKDRAAYTVCHSNNT